MFIFQYIALPLPVVASPFLPPISVFQLMIVYPGAVMKLKMTAGPTLKRKEAGEKLD